MGGNQIISFIVYICMKHYGYFPYFVVTFWLPPPSYYNFPLKTGRLCLSVSAQSVARQRVRVTIISRFLFRPLICRYVIVVLTIIISYTKISVCYISSFLQNIVILSILILYTKIFSYPYLKTKISLTLHIPIFPNKYILNMAYPQSLTKISFILHILSP